MGINKKCVIAGAFNDGSYEMLGFVRRPHGKINPFESDDSIEIPVRHALAVA